MIFPLLVMSSALTLAAVAAYFSIIGLTTIFPGVFWAIVVMGGSLEVGKLITAVWLHRNWKSCGITIRSYLTFSVLILSLITSMGIFGFLSKSHIEQESGSDSIESEIEMLDSKLESASNKKLSLQSQKKTSEELKAEDYLSIQRMNERLKSLDLIISEVRSKGGFSSSKNIAQAQEGQVSERSQISSEKIKIQERMEGYRSNIELNIFPALEKLEEDYLLIKSEKNKLNLQLSQLNAELGPIKYIAEVISDFGGPEIGASSAVRMVILILIFVFDPLAILLIVAGSASLRESQSQHMPKDMLALRSKIISELEMHIGEGKPVESFIEKYQI